MTIKQMIDMIESSDNAVELGEYIGREILQRHKTVQDKSIKTLKVIIEFYATNSIADGRNASAVKFAKAVKSITEEPR